MIQNHKKEILFFYEKYKLSCKMSLELTICQKNGEQKDFSQGSLAEKCMV